MVSTVSGGRGMLEKKLYLNDKLIGEARTWGEVYALIRKRAILFVDEPGDWRQ